jgi:8-oxo-dGTP pyrophosphatase MutT (NUDIX family)
MKWKKLSSNYLHKSNWATLRQDRVELLDGRIMDDYYVLEYPNWVNAVAVTNEGKILMVRQYRHAAGIISLEIPGGVVDGDESAEYAIRRELLEETGYRFETLEHLCTTYGNPSTANNQTNCFLATGGIKVTGQSLDEHEVLLVEQYTIEEVKQLLLDNQIAQAMHCAGLFYGLLKLGKL